jgi:hemolysin activation/secretion protein
VVNTGVSGAWLQGKDIFENELFRFGGLRSLRGFDEESLFATAYVTGKLEYRYIIEQNSFLFLFLNGAWYENRSRNQYLSDTPYGFGTGITFETKPGIFTISYALGSEQGSQILFRSSKIHFGIINYF